MKNGPLVLGMAMMLMLSMGFALADNHTTNETDNMTNVTNVTDGMDDVNDTNETAGAAQVTVKDGWPQGMAYTFACSAEGFAASTYTWTFGDGESLTGPNEVYHEYDAAGAYTVECTAADGEQSAEGELAVTVTASGDDGTDGNETGNQTGNQTGVSVDLYVKEWYPKNNHFVFVCEPNGFTPSSFSWWYGDGHKLLDIQNGDTYHIYEATGSYEVTCQGNGDGVNPQDTMTVTVGALGLPDEGGVDDDDRDARDDDNATTELCSASATIGVTNDGQDYTFTCDDGTSMSPIAYVWDINGAKTHGASNSVTHTFDTAGTYTAHCVASDGISASHGQRTVTVTVPSDNQSTDNGTGDDAVSLSVAGQQDLEASYACTAAGFTADSYELDFGDGTDSVTSSDGTETHVYAAAGDYTATCSVTTDDGRTLTDTAGVTLSAADTGNETEAISVSATLSPAEGATTNASGSVSGTLDGNTLVLDGEITGLTDGELSVPVFLLDTSGETDVVAFALEVEDLGTSANLGLDTEISDELVTALMAGDLVISVDTVDMAGALSGTLEAEA